MTVELAVALPVLVAVAAVAVNALLAFSECAAFDNAFRDAVRLNATSPAYGQGLEQSRAAVQSDLEGAFNRSFESVQVAVEGASGGHVRFTATLEVSPTLFGLGLKGRCSGWSFQSSSTARSLRWTATIRGCSYEGFVGGGGAGSPRAAGVPCRRLPAGGLGVGGRSVLRISAGRCARGGAGVDVGGPGRHGRLGP